MKNTYIDTINNQGQEATMRLYGAIGEKVDGDLFAQELYNLDGLDLIKIRINSPGGDVLQGMSIVSAVLAMNTPVHMYIDGIAASMAGVVAVCGDRVYMTDFSQFMMHDPVFSGQGEVTAKQKKILERMKEMLGRVLSRRGKEEAEISKLMSEETWLSAAQAKEHGLCDEVLPSKRKMANLAPMQILAQIDAENQPIKNENMELTNDARASLNISADATGADISAAVIALGKRATDAEAKLAEIGQKQKEAEAAEAKVLLEAAKKDGRLDADNKDAIASWEKMFENDHAGAMAALGAIPKREAVTPKIDTKNEADKELLDASWEGLDKSGRLADLKAKYPDVFEQKYEERFGRKPAKV